MVLLSVDPVSLLAAIYIAAATHPINPPPGVME